MDKIGIFCSASEHIDSIYFDAAHEIGQWIGQSGKTLVYGGASMGLMERVAQAVKRAGGAIVGVVPTKLEEKNKVSSLPNRIIHTHNLSDRKDKIVEESDILVALPGGVGTLDEIFHVMAAASIGYHQKKVVLYNLNGFYDTLLTALHELEAKGFSRHPLSTYYDVAHTLEELKSIIPSCTINHNRGE